MCEVPLGVALPFGSRWADLLGEAIVTHQDSVYWVHPIIGNAISLPMYHHLLTLVWALADLLFIGGLIWVVWDRLDRSSLWLVAVALWLASL